MQSDEMQGSSAYKKHGSGKEPLNAFPLFQTRDIDRARHAVASKFCTHSLSPAKSAEGFDACHNHLAWSDVSLNYLSYGCEVKIEPGELERFYLIQVPLQGRAIVKNGRVEVRADRSCATVLNPTRDTQMVWGEGCCKLLLQINREALHLQAEELLQRKLSEAVLFAPAVDMRNPGLLHWVNDLFSVVGLAEEGEAFSGRAALRQPRMEESLILGFLTQQPSSISHELREERPDALPHQLRRAQEFINSNLTEPLTLAEISKAAGCSLRSLQVGFRKHFGVTPMGYLNCQRLNHAHYLLQSRTGARRVSTVAFDAGFSHLGRFSIAYRKAFGCSPKETLQYGGPT
ncbi:AraC family transcriptional regulator [Roseobacter sp. SK209-2-6]|uniref:AraC family transcriptional regulator n=1 Tax=Roseobacter sp. SK209-2-6 TaxID=388739 RepID=UPI0003048004|nr:AraC family transcriptional regulator [Roseobacter sp. SK209-2-6]